MKSIIQTTGILLFILGLQVSALADGVKEEILKLARIDLLPQYQEKVLVKQLSSYDTTGNNDDGFSGKYSYLRKENGNLVIADLKGPGVIQRIWTPTPTNDTLQFFFDGEKSPRLELKFIDLFSGKRYPFLRPVVGNEVGGYYCYLPIPYQKSCKIIYKGKLMQFHQIQYRQLQGNQTVSTFPKTFSKEEDQALQSVLGIWKNSGEKLMTLLPDYQKKVKTVSKSVVLKPGDSAPVFSSTTGGRIVGMEITPQVMLNGDFKDLILRAQWDNEPVAAINSPLTDFFGYAFGKPSMQAMLAGVNNGIHYCYFPMPYDRKATLELEYLKNSLNKYSEIPVNVTIYYTDEKRSANEGKFYAVWNREKTTREGIPHQFLKTSGKGHYVGTLLQAQGLNSGMTLFFEGDDICLVDGQMRLHGTGSEDYFNGGWYALADRWDQAYSLPMHGCMAYSVPLAHTAAYRFLMTDKVSFDKSIDISIEHGPENNNVPGDYTSVAFYYCDTPPVSNNVPSDDLLGKINTPRMLEYWLQLLPVSSLANGSAISYGDGKDAKSGKGYEVFKLEAPNDGFARFELEVPANGEYTLYLSYFKSPEGGPFEVSQRQIPLKTMDGHAAENTFVEKEKIGPMIIKEGTNTITVRLKNKEGKSGKSSLMIHRIYLEKKQ
jgi:hypothetical protein